MTLISGEITNLYDGVSQQPPTLRRQTQAEEQINGLSSVVDGVSKRPPSKLLAKVSSTPIASSYIHTYKRDTNEEYIVVISNNNIRVFDATTGTEKVVNATNGFSYLNTTLQENPYSVITVADYTFIVNKDKVPQMKTTLSGGALSGTVQTFSDLPTSPSAGQIYKVTGDANNAFDSYYVKYNGSAWEETVIPGIKYAIDETTMPHKLVRLSDGTFSFQPITWKTRDVGDLTSSPDPSFIGNKITSVFFFRNRLGFSADENVIMSRAGDFFNFFRTSITSQLDDDVIDVAISSNKVSIIRHTTHYSKNLLLFSDTAQFVLSSGQDVLTNSSVQISQSTAYEVSSKAQPITVGSNVYFLTEVGDNSRVMEYYTNETTASNVAADITAHVPKYVPKNIFKIDANANNDILYCLSKDTPNIVYVYRYYWVGNRKPQSAWSKWVFSQEDNILSIAAISNRLLLLVERIDGVFLESIEINNEESMSFYVGYQPMIDRRTLVQGTYDSVTNKTTWVLPYDTNEKVFVVFPTPFQERGGYKQLTKESANTFSLIGDYSSAACYIGISYPFTYRFSTFYLTSQASNGRTIAHVDGRLQIRSVAITYSKAGTFDVVVVQNNTEKTRNKFVSSRLGTQTTTLGTMFLESGTFKTIVGGKNKNVSISVENDTPLPLNMQSAYWEGFYTTRTQRT